MKTSELSGALLDYMVAQIDPKCEGLNFGLINDVVCGYYDENNLMVPCVFIVGGKFNKELKAKKALTVDYTDSYHPSTNWQQGGPIIEREINSLERITDTWYAKRYRTGKRDLWQTGQTPLIAAMRCYVATKFGDEVEIAQDIFDTLKNL